MKPILLFFLVFLMVVCINTLSVAQSNSAVKTDKKPILDLTKKKDEEKETKKEKKIPKKMFYGFKTRRAFTRKGEGDRVTLELFFVLKKWQDPDPFVKDIHWLNRKTRKIEIGPIPENMKPHARILHGPYRKKVGKYLMEEGIFYVGSKHGRWEKYDRNFILLDKTKFFKGFPKESEITYFDSDQKHIKEMVPIQYGKKDGEYYLYGEDGKLIMMGMFKEDVPVGSWIEYYKNKKKKREIECPKDPFSKMYQPPHTLREWDEKGKILFDARKDGIRDTLSFPFK